MFVKGQSGNPAGRPPGAYSKWRKVLEKAIKDAEKKNNQGFFDRIIEMAWNDTVLAAVILRKLVPDLKFYEHKVKIPKSHDDWVKAVQGKLFDEKTSQRAVDRIKGKIEAPPDK